MNPNSSQFTEDNYEMRINQNQHQYVGEFSQQQMKPPKKSVTAPPRQQTAGAAAKRNLASILSVKIQI